MKSRESWEPSGTPGRVVWLHLELVHRVAAQNLSRQGPSPKTTDMVLEFGPFIGEPLYTL